MAYRNEKKTGAYRRVPIAPGQAAYCRPWAGNSGEASGVSAMGGEPAPHQESRHGESASDFGEFFDALLNVLIGGNVVGHDAVVVLAVGDHVEVSGAGESEEDVFGLAGFFAFEGLVDGGLDGVCGFGGGEDAFDAGELFGGFEDVGLGDGDGAHHFLVVEFGEDGAHAVETQAAGVDGAGHEAGAEGLHFGQGADVAGVAEIVGVGAACEARAAGGFDGDEVVIGFAAEFLAHERGDEAAEVGAAAGAADDRVEFDAVFVECGFGFETDDGLMQEDLVEHRAEDVSVSGVGDGVFDGFGNGASEASGGVGIFGEYFLADLCGVGGGGGDAGAVGAHHFAPEGFLFVADLDHVDDAVEFEVGAGHGKCGAPLSGAGFGRDAFEALFFGVVGLGDGGVELVGAGGVVALEFIVNMRGRAEFLFEAVGADEGRGAVHFVEIADRLGDGDEASVVVEFLGDEFVAEHVAEFLGGHGFARGGVEHGRLFFLHVCAHVVPVFGHFGFAEINFIGDIFVAVHASSPWVLHG